MFWKNKGKAKPLGVPLGDLIKLLEPTSIEASVDNETLLARHEHYEMRLEVTPATDSGPESRRIRAVARLTTKLSAEIEEMISSPERVVGLNEFAALGALSLDKSGLYQGSRLTIYQKDDAWRGLHLPMLLSAVICGAEAILGSLRRNLLGQPLKSERSDWVRSDFTQVASYLSRVATCQSGDEGLTAEFGMSESDVSAAAGHQTALFQQRNDYPHPELGGGLFNLLQMPQEIADEGLLREVCLELNNMEMSADDLPPHFGAWCKGQNFNNPVYVSFFPNFLRELSAGVAVNAAFWARERAQWANSVLASKGLLS